MQQKQQANVKQPRTDIKQPTADIRRPHAVEKIREAAKKFPDKQGAVLLDYKGLGIRTGFFRRDVGKSVKLKRARTCSWRRTTASRATTLASRRPVR